jgi:hypothetical protein
MAAAVAAKGFSTAHSEPDKKTRKDKQQVEGQQKVHAAGALVLAPPTGSAAGAAFRAVPIAERRVAVVNFKAAGLGDLSAGSKFLELLRDHIGIPQDRLCMFTDASEENVARFNQAKWDIKLFDVTKMSTTLKAKIDELNIQFLLVGPTDDYFDVMKKWKVPKALIREYGFKGPNAMGLAEDQLGIFIDPNLKQTKRLVPSQNTPRLFVGHSSDNSRKTSFIIGATQSVYALEKAACNIHFIFTGLFFESKEQQKLEQELKKVGAESVRHMDLAAFEEESKKVTSETEANAKARIVTIVTTEQIAHAQFLKFLQKANGALMTGDQSTSEAISTSIPFVYDFVGHKKKFMDSFIALLNKHSIPLATIFKQMNQAINPKDVAVFLHLCNDSEKAKWQSFIEELHVKYDLKVHLRAHLEAALKSDPLVGSKFTSYAAMDPQVFTGALTDLPFDQEVVITETQCSELSIDKKTKLSVLKTFQGSLFETYQWAYDAYVVKRIKHP